MRLVLGIALAIFTSSSAVSASEPEDYTRYSEETLLFGCRDDMRGPTMAGWCDGDEFYGPLFLGSVFYTGSDDLKIYGIGQVGVVNKAEYWGGFLRVGLVNVGHSVDGGDVALVTYDDHESAGVKVVGLVAYANDLHMGAQIAGLVAIAEGVNGLQLAALAAYAEDRSEGLQIGAFTYAEDITGLQIGVVTTVGEWTTGQLGVVNYGADLRGLQLGVVNIADESEGVQIGVFNYAHTLHGLQIGVFNVAVNDGLPFMVIANAGF